MANEDFHRKIHRYIRRDLIDRVIRYSIYYILAVRLFYSGTLYSVTYRYNVQVLLRW